MRSASPRKLALLILLPAIAFWSWFAVASASGEQHGAGNWLIHLAFPPGMLAGMLLLAWRAPRVGGSLLVGMGTAIGVAYPVAVGSRFPWTTSALVIATIALPMAAAGLLLLAAAGRRSARSPA